MSKKSKSSKKANKSDSIEQAAMETYADSNNNHQEHSEDDTQIRSAVVIDETASVSQHEESLEHETPPKNEASKDASKQTTHSELTADEAPTQQIDQDKSSESDTSETAAKEAFSNEAETIAVNATHDEEQNTYNTMTNDNAMNTPLNKDADTKQASAKKPGKTIAWIALILALIAVIIASYTWWLSEQKRDLAGAINSNIAAFSDKLASIQQSSTTQQTQQSSSLEALQQKLQAQTTLAQQQQTQLNQIQAALDKLQAKQTGNASYWRMLEVKHLLQTAAIKLAVERDSATAIALLDTANIKLEGQLNSLELQKAIASDIGSIKANYPISPSRLLMQVESLQQQLLVLPLINMTPEEVQNTYAKETEVKQSKDWLDKIIDAAKPAYNIIPVNRALEPLLQPSERHYLLMNMTLSTQQLQVAIAAGNQALKDTLIEKLMRWTSQYFDDKQEATKQFVEALGQLKAVKLHATPEPLKSLEWIEQNATLTSGAL
jgi:uroporphyrin-III C-methyltransferase